MDVSGSPAIRKASSSGAGPLPIERTRSEGSVTCVRTCSILCLALNPVCVAWVVTASVNRAHSWPHSHEGTKHEFMNQPGRRSTYTSRQ
eukprot:3303222-Prymnesium_polylepis.1